MNQKSASDEMERVMIGKLKLKCGTQFTSKLEGMLNDLTVGADHQTEFDAHCNSTNILGKMELQVSVLTTGHWPTFKSFDNIHLPTEMLTCIKAFQQFYESKTNHRRVTWMHSLGHVSLKGIFGNGKNIYEIQVTTLQAIVLLYFSNPLENKEPKSMESLITTTNMPEEVLKRVLHSLSCGKLRVLKRTAGQNSENGGDAANKSIKLTDLFSFNEAFT